MRFKNMLKVGATLDGKLTTAEENVFRTIDVRFVQLLSYALRFKFKLVAAADGGLGRLESNGSWSGLIGMANRGEIDFAVAPMSLTEDRWSGANWSYPYSHDIVTFATVKSVYRTTWVSYLKPFSFSVWICIVISLVAVSFAIHATSKDRVEFQKILLRAYGAVLQEQIVVNPVKTSEYLIISSWIIGTTFIIYSYTALLLSFMTVPTLSGVRTISELSAEVAKGTYTCYTVPGSFLVDDLLKSIDPAIRIIGQDLKKNKMTRDVEDMQFKNSLTVGATLDSRLTTAEKKVFRAIDVRFAQLLSYALRFKINLVAAADGGLGRLESNGSWSGLIGMANRGEIDFAVTSMSLTEDRWAGASWSYPYSHDIVTFATVKPVYRTTWMSYLKPFSFNVWICLAMSLIAASFVIYGTSKNRFGFQRIFLSAYGAILQKDMKVNPLKTSEYFIISSWIIGTAFIIYSYTALLLSFLTIPTLSGVRTISELSAEVAKGTYTCYTVPGSFLVDDLLKSTDPAIRIIGQDLKKNKVTRDVEGTLSDRSSKVPAFVRGGDPLTPYSEKYFLSEDPFFNAFLSMPIKKNFCCKRDVDRVMTYIWDSGLYKKITRDENFREKLKVHFRTSGTTEEITDSHRQLTVGDFKGIFAFLVLGYAIAVIVFAVEVSYAFISKKRGNEECQKSVCKFQKCKQQLSSS